MGRTIKVAAVVLAVITLAYGDGPAREKFETASVRISPLGSTGTTSWSDMGSGTFTAKNTPLRILVGMAYGVDDKQILGEDKLGTELYDVSARPEGGGKLSYERLHPMLESLLAERFGLVVHRETKVFSGYALVPAKTGVKLQASGATAAGQSSILPGRLIGHAVGMAVLASMLGRPLGAPVADKTGIEGTYEVDLKFAPEGSTDSSRPSIFTAVQEQLGLKLESQKVPLEMLVIDHCERVPTEN